MGQLSDYMAGADLRCSGRLIFSSLLANSSGNFRRLHPNMEAKDREEWQAWLREIRRFAERVGRV